MGRKNSLRNSEWDYRSIGYYFITIITKDREQYFGQVSNKKMNPSNIGELTMKYWEEIPDHFQNVKLGKYILMPDHFHGVIHINKNRQLCNNALQNRNFDCSKNEYMSSISPKPLSLSTIIRSFKSAVTKDARLINPDFSWQRSFHDKIIKQTEIPFYNRYIEENPKRWDVNIIS
ncbi:transposase [Marinigracilibium pacificum]|uniref:Transposase n=1 Tax=Marinigracilibium pacificum TaxID=2729599 RepID=A0A848IWG5_9BACT|nr:transposase [Marinigracilibium pacificum]NMM47508.1 transposase [Marinigracilibium pacificum]